LRLLRLKSFDSAGLIFLGNHVLVPLDSGVRCVLFCDYTGKEVVG